MYNHYAKLKNIINSLDENWVIVKINKPTKTKKFNEGYNYYDHYYRIYVNNEMVKFGKFQQLDKLASVLDLEIWEIEERIINKDE